MAGPRERIASDPLSIDQRGTHQFFQEEVARAAARMERPAPPLTQIYVADVLHRFTTADAVFVDMEGRRELEPLAFMLKRAAEAPDSRDRTRILRHLGDTALYTSGLLCERIERRGLDVGYYIEMGGQAYAVVAGATIPKLRELYEELSIHFRALVRLLWELAEGWRGLSQAQLLDLYRRWRATRCDRIARRLAAAGFALTPVPARS